MDDVIIHDAPGDRLILELYAWVATDHRTGLEGLFGMAGGPLLGEMPAITSSLELALKLGKVIESMPIHNDRTFRLIRFKKAEVVREL